MADELDGYRVAFDERSSGSEPSWLVRARAEALERFLDRGFPRTSEEDWRFTSLRGLASQKFRLPGRHAHGAGTRVDYRLGGSNCHELVFVNGRFSEELSSISGLPAGLQIRSLARVLEDDAEAIRPVLPREGGDGTVFADLNRAFFTDGAFIHVGPGTVVERPVHLVFLSTETSTMSHPFNAILAEARSELRIVESYVGADESVYWTNAVTHIAIGEGAVLDHYKLQREGAAAFHIGSLSVVETRDAVLRDHSISLGARLSRHDIRVILEGEGSDTSLNGLYSVRGTQHVDHHTLIDHRAPRCTSRELYKGVLDQESTGVFDGRIVVRPKAQKTNAQQSNKNLLLSRNALVNTNPRLEINADDVKCAHGATIGQLDADALFYLRSRGIELSDARHILTRGFLADVTERIQIETLRQAVSSLVLPEVA